MTLSKKIITTSFYISYLLAGLPEQSICQSATDSLLAVRRQKAMGIFERTDTSKASPLWPHIKPSLFFSNVRKNILYPEKINQGRNTNFCGHAALTHILAKYQPDVYIEIIFSLYHTGKANLYSKRVLQSGERIRAAAGALKDKGELNIRHADQLWFLTLADNFKGYLNVFNRKYNEGDENTFWAATNYRKFNKMLREFGGYKTKAIGSDLRRPRKTHLFSDIQNRLDTGIVIMYIAGRRMYPHKFFYFHLPIPTHFVVLYDLYENGGRFEIKYWDYGLKTEQVVSARRLRKSIYGLTSIARK